MTFMKTGKKILIAAIALSLLLCLVAPAFAAGDDASLANLKVNTAVMVPVKLLAADQSLINLDLNINLKLPLNLLNLIKVDIDVPVRLPIKAL